MAEVRMPGDVVASEFAAVQVSIDRSGNGPRLRLHDLRGDRVVYLDALALETVIWLPDEVLQEFHDPSAVRWQDETAPEPAVLSSSGQS